MTHLEALAAKYGTDKLDHGYIPFYEKYLPKEPKRILEIGVLKGSSLKMWKEYFPSTEVHGLELLENQHLIDPEILHYQSGYKIHYGNQCDWEMLEQLRKFDFDVIIDDGSHIARHQMMTFFGLFNGKQYYIEDLHCPREQFYQDGLPYLYTADQLFPRNDGRYNIIYDNNIVLIHS